MITRYALGPHIILIGRESIKQRLKNSFRCQICSFTWRKNKRILGEETRVFMAFKKASESNRALGSYGPCDRKSVRSSSLCWPLASAPPPTQLLSSGPGSEAPGSRLRPLKGEAASQGQRCHHMQVTWTKTNCGLPHI